MRILANWIAYWPCKSSVIHRHRPRYAAKYRRLFFLCTPYTATSQHLYYQQRNKHKKTTAAHPSSTPEPPSDEVLKSSSTTFGNRREHHQRQYQVTKWIRPGSIRARHLQAKAVGIDSLSVTLQMVWQVSVSQRLLPAVHVCPCHCRPTHCVVRHRRSRNLRAYGGTALRHRLERKIPPKSPLGKCAAAAAWSTAGGAMCGLGEKTGESRESWSKEVSERGVVLRHE